MSAWNPYHTLPVSHCGSSMASRFDGRNREVERGALADRAFRPDSTGVAIDNSMHRGEPDSRSREIRFAMQTLEWAEEIVGIFHIKSRAIVTNEEHGVPSFLVGPDFNPRLRDFCGELPCVPNQIVERHAHEPAIGLHQKLILDAQGNLPIRVVLLQFLGDDSGHAREINSTIVELGAANP